MLVVLTPLTSRGHIMKLSKTSFAAGAVAALVIGSGSAYAATGGKFILGYSNSAGATSTLSNANGTALYLKSKAGTPSLKVNSSTKVPYLNSDSLDGLDQSAFARSAMKTGSFDTEAVDIDDWSGDGTVSNIWAQATCPAGTQLTGGGVNDFTETGTTWFNGPIGDNSWEVDVLVDGTVDADPSYVIASVVCLNAKGAVSGSYRVSATDLDAAHDRIVARGKTKLTK